MTINELGQILRDMYDNAPDGDKVAMIHLFGIRYSDEIMEKIIENNDNKLSVMKEILKNTKLSNKEQMPASYEVEISKGLRLSKYVIEK